MTMPDAFWVSQSGVQVPRSELWDPGSVGGAGPSDVNMSCLLNGMGSGICV